MIDLADLDGIGETQIKSIQNFLSNNKNSFVIKNLVKFLDIEDHKEINKKGKLVIKLLCLQAGLKNK